MWTFKLREGVKWQDGEPFTADDVVFTFETIIEDEVSNYVGYTEYIETVKALDPQTVEFTCSKAKTNMLGMPIPILPEHIWSKLTAAQITNTYPNDAADDRHRPLPGRRVEARRVRARRGQQGLLARRAQGRRGRVEPVQEPGHDGRRPQVRRPPGRLGHPAGAVRAAERRSEPGGHRRRPQRLQPHGLQLLRGQGLAGEPGAQGRRLPPRAQLGDRQAEDRRHRLLRARGAGDDDHPRRLLQAPARLPLAAGRGRGRTPSTPPGPAPSSTPPATRTPTATASARTRPASRSSCACTRAPSRPPTSASASSSPAGSRRSASRSTTRSSTKAR